MKPKDTPIKQRLEHSYKLGYALGKADQKEIDKEEFLKMIDELQVYGCSGGNKPQWGAMVVRVERLKQQLSDNPLPKALTEKRGEKK